ncbi:MULTISPECIES: DJ-1/PfpI family protein [Rahnella]|uniref:DJ-1/PfpI family protein n=1 Tax=Rahnella TaxID=34037 RepID=UPI00092EAA98|nr:DJ-1/PfpI family protein [Rahnella rivi]MBU9829445.1 DJ-1/PfpI family protein [Rahnella rivi]
MELKNHSPLQVGILVCPGVAIMDLLGAHAVFGMTPEVELHILWKNKDLIEASPRLPLAATTTFDECPPLDVLVMGAVPADMNRNPDILAFIARQSQHDPYLMAICGGALLLGAVGLLKGRKATTNFHLLESLPLFGAEAVPGGAVVQDGKLLTAGPATGGFEAALRVLAALRGEHQAKLVELTIEYHPQPVFGVGTPERAGEELTRQSKALYKDHFGACRDAALSYYRAR